MNWEILSTETLTENEYFTVKKDRCRKKDGSIVDPYYVIERPEVAIIVALTEENDVVLLNQYRHPIKQTGIEVPAGHIEKDETPEAGARRELKEETGYTVETMTKLQTNFASVGLLNQKIHIFLATGAKKTHELELDDNEELEVVLKSWQETLEMLHNGELQDIDSIAAILLAQKHV